MLRFHLSYVLVALLLAGCLQSESIDGGLFVTEQEGCTQDLWRLDDFQQEFVVEGTTIKLALDTNVDAEEARALVGVVGDANRLLPADIKPLQTLRVLVCGEGGAAYNSVITDKPIVVVPVRYKIDGGEEAAGAKASQAVFLHEYGHVVFDAYLSSQSEGYAAYKKQGQQLIDAYEEFQRTNNRDPNYLTLRLRIRDLSLDKNRYHRRARPFTELVADTLAVATLRDGKAVTQVFAEVSAPEQYQLHTRFRDFTLEHAAENTPFDPYLVFAPTRTALWRTYGNGTQESWGRALSLLFKASAAELDAWVAQDPRNEHDDATTLNRALFGRMLIQ